MTDLTDRAHEITVRRAREAAERLESTDLTIAEAALYLSGAPHLKPTVDRLAAAAAEITEGEHR